MIELLTVLGGLAFISGAAWVWDSYKAKKTLQRELARKARLEKERLLLEEWEKEQRANRRYGMVKLRRPTPRAAARASAAFSPMQTAYDDYTASSAISAAIQSSLSDSSSDNSSSTSWSDSSADNSSSSSSWSDSSSDSGSGFGGGGSSGEY